MHFKYFDTYIHIYIYIYIYIYWIIPRASRSQVDIYTPKPKQYKPTAILFDALEKAVNEKYELVLVDTCGRMHNNETLMKELSSMCRIVEKKLGRGICTPENMCG